MRAAREAAIANGELPDFPAASAHVRDAEWRVVPRATDAAEGALLLPDVQSASEANAWAGRLAKDGAGREAGVVLWVDSLWGAFEFEHILFELREVVAGAYCDADGFLFGFIDAFQQFPEFVLPDRDDINEATHFLRSFRQLVATACLRRGTTVSDPDWPEIGSGEVPIEAADLLLVPRGRITERGMRQNIRTALDYLGGNRENRDDRAALRAASAARLAAAQLWQWVRHETGVLDVGRIVTPTLFESLLEEELGAAGDRGARGEAASALAATVLGESFTMQAFCEAAGRPEPVK